MTTRNEEPTLTRRHASTLLAAVAILSVSLGVAHAESQQHKVNGVVESQQLKTQGMPESNQLKLTSDQHKLTSDQQKWPEQPAGGLQSNQLKVESTQPGSLTSNQHKLTPGMGGGMR